METKTNSSISFPVGSASSSPSLSRRSFVCVSCGCGLALSALPPRASAAWGDPIEVGPLSSFSRDEISEKYLQNSFFVIRHNGRLYAATSSCPHEQNSLYVNTSNPEEILCSGHQSAFDFEGRPLPGGRTQDALIRFGIAVDDKGMVRVDTNKRFSPEQWEDPESFVPIKKS
jgi:nitrite reductase/ring-hydroxylating ferredoxin subunit